MNEHLLNILKEHGNVSEQQLLDYLNGKLSAEERHAIELQMAEHEMMMDAEEGLAMVQDKQQLETVSAQLNASLTEQLKKRRNRNRRELPNQSILITATFIILVLIVIAFMVIYKMQLTR
jgi:anti-sigma factor RsiW